MLSASAHQPELCAAVASLTFTCRLQGVGTLFGKSEGPSVERSVMTGPLEINVSWGRFKVQRTTPPNPSLPDLLSPKPPPRGVVLPSGLFFLQQNSAEVSRRMNAWMGGMDELHI